MLNRNAVSLAAKVSNLRERQMARGGLPLGAPRPRFPGEKTGSEKDWKDGGWEEAGRGSGTQWPFV